MKANLKVLPIVQYRPPFKTDSEPLALAAIIAKGAGLKLRLHDLRHTHATLMLKSGVHPKIVSEALGHSSVAFTLDVYSHLVPGLQEAAGKRLDEVLEPGLNEARNVGNRT